MEREFVAKIDGRGVDDDAGSILIYRLGGQVSLACCPNPGARTAESARCPERTISASFCTGWVRADMAVRAPFDLGNTPSLAVGVLFGKSPKYRPKRVDLFGV